MSKDDYWTSEQTSHPAGDRTGDNPYRSRQLSPVRISLLFACGVLALSVMVTPIISERTLDMHARNQGPAYDNIMTGSVERHSPVSPALNNYPGDKKNFIIRRSITQGDDTTCEIFDNRRQIANC